LSKNSKVDMYIHDSTLPFVQSVQKPLQCCLNNRKDINLELRRIDLVIHKAQASSYQKLGLPNYT